MAGVFGSHNGHGAGVLFHRGGLGARVCSPLKWDLRGVEGEACFHLI